MTGFTIQQTSKRSGLSEPTLRYYEEVGLLTAVARDQHSGHRRYSDQDLETARVLSCLRATGVGIEDMRAYQANRSRGRDAADEQRDLLLRQAERIEAQIAAQHARLSYLRAKAALWDARSRNDLEAEAAALEPIQAAFDELEANAILEMTR